MGDRRKRKRINEGIGWMEHCMRLLGGVTDRMARGSDKKGEDEKEEISGEKVKRVITKLKDGGKAAGLDGIPNKVWKYEEEVIGKRKVFVTGSGKERGPSAEGMERGSNNPNLKERRGSKSKGLQRSHVNVNTL